MTFDEFKTEFLATVNLDEYKKKDSYIHSVLNDLSVQDVSLEEYRELKALTLKCVKEDRLNRKLKELEEDF